ncbi:MAG: hypothetical protein IT326_00190 [Anaerolineae bacterium]|nr:hypothetical protein [Anaerolineae bacterium]
MGVIRLTGKVLGLILLLAFIVLLPVSIWLYNVQGILLNRATYERLLTSDDLYTEALPTLASAVIIDSINAPESPDLTPEARLAGVILGSVPAAASPQMGQALFSPEWLEEQTRRNFDALFDWFEGDIVRPAIAVDLSEMKARLGGDAGRDVVELVVSGWPACSTAQMVVMEAALAPGSATADTVPACEPAGDLRDTLVERASASLAFVSEELPESIPPAEDLARPLTEQEEFQYRSIKLAARVFYRTAFLIFAIPLLFLLLIEIVAVRSFKSLFHWSGWGLLLGGLLALLLSLEALPLALVVAMSGGQSTPVGMQSAILLMSVLNQVSRSIFVQGGLVIAAGFLLLILARLIPPPHNRDDTTDVYRHEGPDPRPARPV